MAFKIKDGVRIGTTDIFNNSAESLNIKVKDTNGGAGVVALKTESLGITNYEQKFQADDGIIALTSDIGNAELTLAINGTAGATNTTVTIGTGTGFTANDTSNITYDLKIGPALTELAAELTGTTTGYLKKTGADAITLSSVVESISFGTTGLTPATPSTGAVTVAGTLITSNGGTGLNTYAAGDILYYSSGTALSRLPKGTDGQVLKLASGLPSWSADTNTDTLQSIANDTSTVTNQYISFVASTSGAQTGKVHSTGLLFQASTANLTLGGDIAVNGGDITTSSTTATIFNTTATTLNIGGAATTISIGAATGDTTVNNNLVITGNLTVSGTTTTINVDTVTVEDKNIVLGNVTTPTDVTANDGGILVKGTTDKTFYWKDATDAWTSSEHLALAAGKDLLLSGATSGTITVVVPNVAGTNTITIPAKTDTLAVLGDIGNAELTLAINGTAGATNTTVTIGTGTGFTANDTSNITYDLKIGPALTELAAELTGTTTGYLKKTGADAITLSSVVESISFGTTGLTPATPSTGAVTVAGTLITSNGGTGLSSYTAGDILYYSSGTALSRLAKGTDGQVLKLVSGLPAWTTDIDTNTDTLQSIADDTSANSRFITFVNSATGAQTGGSSANIKFVPSTGTLTTTKIATTEIALGASAATPKVFTNVITPSAITVNTATAVDTWDADLYRSAIYVIQITQGTEYQFGEVRVLHDGTSVYLTEYAVLENGLIGSAGTQQPTFTGAISGTSPNLVFTLSVTIGDAATTNANMIIERKLFAV